jgi:hypothetical protein
VTRSIKLGAAAALLAGAGTIALLVHAVLRATEVECEVCVRYGGRLVCRAAAGTTREEALHTATENACAFLASGMTESIRCGNTSPETATCNVD